jgi:hypothetical protein
LETSGAYLADAPLHQVLELLLDEEPSLDIMSALLPLVLQDTPLAELLSRHFPSRMLQHWQSSSASTLSPPSDDNTYTQALYGANIIKSLKHPVAPTVTLVITSLLFSCLPWTHVQIVTHALVVSALLHGMLPLGYRMLYEKPMRELREVAGTHGLSVVPTSPLLLNASVQAQYEQQQLEMEDSAVSWMSFCGWLLFRILALLQFFFSVPGAPGMLSIHLASGLLLLPLRYWAIRARSLNGVRSVNTGMATLLLSFTPMSMYTYWWLIDQPAPLLPFFVSTSPPPWAFMFGMVPMWLLTTVTEVFTLVGPLDPFNWVVFAHCASSVLWCGLLMDAAASHWYGVHAPYSWVTWFICMFTVIMTGFFGARTWLECSMMKNFLNHLSMKKEL